MTDKSLIEWSRGVLKRACIFQIIPALLLIAYSLMMPDFVMSYDLVGKDMIFRFLLGVLIFASGWAMMSIVYNGEIIRRMHKNRDKELQELKQAVEDGKRIRDRKRRDKYEPWAE